MNERSGGCERSEQSVASERVSGASERANGRASGPVLQSVFLAVIDHSEEVKEGEERRMRERGMVTVESKINSAWHYGQ